MTAPLAPQYDPSQIESPLYAWWRSAACSIPSRAARTGRRPGEPYVIQMPPPNVTAELHIGHGLNNTVQDVLIRFERMRGRRALWVPGTDHAGIATQNVVERLLAKEGLTRFDLGREAFVERVWAYVRETGAPHPGAAPGHRLLGRLVPHLLHPGRGPLPRGARSRSCGCTRRGWSTAATTSSTGVPAASPRSPMRRRRRRRWTASIWHVRYPLAGGDGHVTIATTRPETHARRHRRRGPSGRRALPATWWARPGAAARRPADPGGGRRGRGSRLRLAAP